MQSLIKREGVGAGFTQPTGIYNFKREGHILFYHKWSVKRGGGFKRSLSLQLETV